MKNHKCNNMNRLSNLGTIFLGDTMKVCPFCGDKV